jgi:hypothetical protein
MVSDSMVWLVWLLFQPGKRLNSSANPRARVGDHARRQRRRHARLSIQYHPVSFNFCESRDSLLSTHTDSHTESCRNSRKSRNLGSIKKILRSAFFSNLSARAHKMSGLRLLRLLRHQAGLRGGGGDLALASGDNERSHAGQPEPTQAQR